MKELRIPILWHVRLHVSELYDDNDGYRAQVFMESKLLFEAKGSKEKAVGEAVDYIAEHFCVIDGREAKQILGEKECAEFSGSLSTNGDPA